MIGKFMDDLWNYCAGPSVVVNMSFEATGVFTVVGHRRDYAVNSWQA
jgi:hypothetical protein